MPVHRKSFRFFSIAKRYQEKKPIPEISEKTLTGLQTISCPNLPSHPQGSTCLARTDCERGARVEWNMDMMWERFMKLNYFINMAQKRRRWKDRETSTQRRWRVQYRKRGSSNHWLSPPRGSVIFSGTKSRKKNNSQQRRFLGLWLAEKWQPEHTRRKRCQRNNNICLAVP